MVKVIASSDFHGQLPNIEECDLLLICGDICPNGSATLQAKWLDTIFRKWLNDVPAKAIVGVAGNHDRVFEKGERLIPNDLRWHYLKDQMIEICGLKIYGMPWQLPFWGAFNLEEKRLAERYSLIPNDVDIVISHAPPHGIFDEVRPINSDEILHTGSISLRNKLFEVKPKLFVCGHIHCAFGTCVLEDIIFANVSLLDDQMKVAHQPLVFMV